MSSFSREKLSLHLRRRMGVFVSRVKAIELMPNLPCLTLSDKEEIQAKKDFSGNYAAMQLLLDYVQKRMNWPEELISGLETLEHQDLAEELRAEWNKHNQSNPYPPSAAATTAVKTHVHPIPSTSSEGSPYSLVLPAHPAPPAVSAPLAVAPPEASLPPEVAPEVLPPPVVAAQPEAPPSLVPEAPVAGSSSEPASHAPEAAVSPDIASEAAPSPVAAPQAAPPSPVSADEPTGISEPPASSRPGPIDVVSLEDNSSHSDAPTPIALSETTPSLSGSDLIPAVTEITPTLPVSHLALSQTESTPAAWATFQSPERRPVQDTSPHTVNETSFHQEAVEDSDPTQVTEDDQHTEPPQIQHFSAATALPPVDTSMNEDDVNFSKPEVLRSEVMDSQPYSGDSTRLQMSVSHLVLATADVNSPVVVPDPVTTSTPLPCQENGVPEEITEPLSHNEPQEDTYESHCMSSLGDQEVLLNVVHVSEEASIQNNDGQTPSMLGIVVHMSEEPCKWNQDGQTQSMLGNNDVGVSETPPPVQNHNSQSQITPLSGSTALDLSSGPNQHGQSQGLIMIVNGQDASPSTKHPDAPAPTGFVPFVNGSSSAENRHPLGPMGAEVLMEARAVPELKQERAIGESYYLLGAAVVAVSALFMAWRMKN
ncbi:sterile alpha motif domain-containing protein 1-like [Salvelinus fontinalis]|uniref:sterile alpha motif domain-containing protein 1-like n=1 Tax=Salvelinus fontinalis TaxID=8038 RepID=UPI002485304A|nr:sterile alpha motif domain-containing protein 1-like [Salvelinus fontinalis]XP_055718778.1 sterile alpha motif domain-containing protein 1-like [Salvelinus fontinalis]XP_055718779.1 sterile alpha motif domain-containing protein 1-like [Salvelinus fontinalis]XP_055718780.1 sterile alpha motif domain-containing protein 1-like [Salvelinus fontinalis]